MCAGLRTLCTNCVACSVLASCSPVTTHRMSRRRPHTPTPLAAVITSRTCDRISPVVNGTNCVQYIINVQIYDFVCQRRHVYTTCAHNDQNAVRVHLATEMHRMLWLLPTYAISTHSALLEI